VRPPAQVLAARAGKNAGNTASLQLGDIGLRHLLRRHRNHMVAEDVILPAPCDAMSIATTISCMVVPTAISTAAFPTANVRQLLARSGPAGSPFEQSFVLAGWSDALLFVARGYGE
jgi:hypothetical protein